MQEERMTVRLTFKFRERFLIKFNFYKRECIFCQIFTKKSKIFKLI